MNDDITLVTIYGDHNPEFIDDFVRSSFEQVLKVISVSRDKMLDIHGFDEYFKGWGEEDNDLVDRLRQEEFDVCYAKGRVAHQWHPRNLMAANRVNVEKMRQYALMEEKPVMRNPSEWGKL